MRFDELYEFLSENTLNRYNLYKVYISVFELNTALYKLGFDRPILFPKPGRIVEAYMTTEPLSESMFAHLMDTLSEPHFDEIEMLFFNHCKKLAGEK